MTTHKSVESETAAIERAKLGLTELQLGYEMLPIEWDPCALFKRRGKTISLDVDEETGEPDGTFYMRPLKKGQPLCIRDLVWEASYVWSDGDEDEAIQQCWDAFENDRIVPDAIGRVRSPNSNHYLIVALEVVNTHDLNERKKILYGRAIDYGEGQNIVVFRTNKRGTCHYDVTLECIEAFLLHTTPITAPVDPTPHARPS